jgi:hypothetical protein
MVMPYYSEDYGMISVADVLRDLLAIAEESDDE